MAPLSQTFGGGRRFAILINVILMVGLAVAAAAIVIYLTGFTNFRHRIDLTAARTYTLSQETLRLLETLDRDVEILSVFDSTLQPWDPEQVFPKAMEYTSDLLQEYRVRSNGRLTAENLDPRHDASRVMDLFRELGLRSYNMVIVRSGKNKRVLSLQNDLAEIDVSQLSFGGPPVLVAYRTEEALSTALYQVTQDKPVKAYVITGHEEMSTDSGAPTEAGLVVSNLKQDNVDAEKLPLFSQRVVPQDADLVIVLNPRQAYVDDERAALDDYMRRGGRLLIAADPLADRSLDPWLLQLGLVIERNFICHSQGGALKDASPAETWVGNSSPGDFGRHPITDAMIQANDLMVIPLNGAVAGAPGTETRFTSLLLSHPDAFGDVLKDDKEPGNFIIEPRLGERAGQRAFAAALEPAGAHEGSRVVYIAGSVWCANKVLNDVVGNAKFLRRSVAWLTGRNKQVVHVPPRTPRVARAELRASEYDTIFAYTVLYLPAGALLLAVLVWFARR